MCAGLVPPEALLLTWSASRLVSLFLVRTAVILSQSSTLMTSFNLNDS